MGIENIIFMVFNFLICIFDAYVFFMFWDYVLERKVKSKKVNGVCLLGLALVMFLINTLGSSKLNLIMTFVVHIAACLGLYVGECKKKIFFAVSACLLMLSGEFIFICLSKFELIGKTLIINSVGHRIMAIISTKLIAFLIIKFICGKMIASQKHFYSSEANYFYFFPMSCMVLFIGIDYYDVKFSFEDFSSMLILFGCFFLLISVFSLFFIYEKMTVILLKMKNYEMITNLNSLEKEHYERLEEINKGHSQLIHSITDFMTTITALAHENHGEQIVKIVEGFNAKVLNIREINFCNDPIIDAVLKSKEWEAKKNGVKFRIFIEKDFSLEAMKEIDVICILSNLINNGIEAARECESGSISVHLYFANDHRFAIIKVCNDFKTEPIIENGIFVSKKVSGDEHGIGINYTKQLIESYGGVMEIKAAEKEFSVTVMFFV